MHLLKTDDYTRETFIGNDIPLYVILSHRWMTEEITFQDAMNIRTGDGGGYKKVREACLVAKKEGFKYIWIDTCCIDKTSSAELSEAINSMYRWFQDSIMCYAYLDDVQPDYEITKSAWFTRGWTLQELIAPQFLKFFNRDWTEIGTKTSLQTRLTEITGIPGTILEGADLDSSSIAQRMSWASRRTTTRIEDTAYCLMGLFDVNMPLLYGEGEKAFTRLQEEIIRKSDDHSIFAFESSGSILAPSPINFSSSGNIVPTTDDKYSSSGTISISKRGIHLRADFHGQEKFKYRWAILPCMNERKEYLKLFLYCPSGGNIYSVKVSSGLQFSSISGLVPTFSSICVISNRQTKILRPPLTRAVEAGDEAIVRCLLAYGSKLHTYDMNMPEALRAAVSVGHKTIVQLLLREGVDPNYGLQEAVNTWNEAVIRLLLEKGVNPDDGLWGALETGKEAFCRLLLERSYLMRKDVTSLAAVQENSRDSMDAS